MEGICENCIKGAQREKIQEQERVDKERQERIIAALAPAQALLSGGNIIGADQVALEQGSDELLDEYEKIKSKYIQKDLRNLEKELEVGEGYFDDEKAVALSKTGKNILVQARAGSGKTTAIALRVRHLIKFYGAKPEEILILAFNRKAAEEFRLRINSYFKGSNQIATESNTLTFHALARRIANTTKNILQDESRDGSEEGRHGEDKKLQIDFVRECFNKVEKEGHGLIEKLFYLFLKSASEKIGGLFRNSEDYYLYLRNLQHVTIAGEIVKSRGEKYIADFLFEHRVTKNGREIEYAYERNIKKNINATRPYSPDFSLFFVEDEEKLDLQAVVEFFGFTESYPGYPGFFESRAASRSYLNEAEQKRILFRDKDMKLVEMNANDLTSSADVKLENKEDANRQWFEEILRQRLTRSGFDISKECLSIKEILAKIPKVERRKKALVKQITQFINKAQKISYDPDTIRTIAGKEKENGRLSKRTEYFIKMACRVYEEYHSRLEKEPFTDFDGLLVDAIKRIKNEGSVCKILPKGGKGESQDIGNIKYILIDEYQDFSKLFCELIDAIRTNNPQVSFFCVGDDWQAINAFAGSDLEYFDNFEKYFVGGRRTKLLTNYRSCAHIIEHANCLMRGRGDDGKPQAQKAFGRVYLMSLLWVENRRDQEYEAEFLEDEKYRSAAKLLLGLEDADKAAPFELVSYLKTVEKVVNDLPSDKNICLLFRGNHIRGSEITKFTEQIRAWTSGNKNRVICSTAHGFKGKECDAIVVVDANHRSYPKFHPDNELMEILGVTLSKVIDEERRLFYVAITRAKESLYLLYDNGATVGISDFIGEIEKGGWNYELMSSRGSSKKLDEELDMGDEIAF